MSAKGAHKEVQEWARCAVKAGWRVEHRTRHLVFIPPDPTAQLITVAFTPNTNGLRQDRQRLQRAGLRV